MAKINKASRKLTHHKVLIHVEDPHCFYSIKPNITFFRVFKSSNPNAAVKEAAIYCNKYMKEYPGTLFKYSTERVEPYNYYENIFKKEDL
ncbi:MAG: hypothetical protein EBU90_18715 [Proteobacteria bacterium]|nr:hypothetical protein [Pseudomonadota bacterium]NBP16236.1 hypothetical protein [bacterium]